MTLTTITIAISIVLLIGAISVALEEHRFADLFKQARVEWANVRSRFRAAGRHVRLRRVGSNQRELLREN